MNIIVQIIYFMWLLKIGINQDEYNCVVTRSSKKHPNFYDKNDFDKVMKDPSAVDITAKYEQVFGYSLVTWVILDLTLIFTYFKYRRSIINKDENTDYTCTLLFFIFFIFFGIVELIMLTALRLSPEGKVCSGDYIISESDNKIWEKHQGYFMIFEGNFVMVSVAYECVSVLLFIIMYFVVNKQKFYKNNMESSYMGHSATRDKPRAVEIILKQLKFQPKEKWVRLKEMYAVDQIYRKQDDLPESGIFGKSIKAKKILIKEDNDVLSTDEYVLK